MHSSGGTIVLGLVALGLLALARWWIPAVRAWALRSSANAHVPSADIDAMLDQLARRSWPAREDAEAMPFEFQTIMASNNLEVFVGDLLNHIRLVAPQLNVPFMTPRVVIEGMAIAAGQFVEQDGWVKIAVSSNFLADVDASRAILCHEVCHYVLNANGIRMSNTDQNERLTDVAMFVFGLGGVFAAGYRRDGRRDYRQGHKLGYLSDADYAYARKRSLDLWRAGGLHTSQLAVLEMRLKASIPDASVRNRLLGHARSKMQGASEADLIRSVLASYRSDQR